MQKAKQYLFNITWMLSFSLTVLLLMGSRVQVPTALQVAGRMHPLVLHFPIVLVALYLGWLLLVQRTKDNSDTLHNTGEWIFLLGVSGTVITALAGFFLSREPGYDADALHWHLWLGTGAALYMTAWYAFLKNAGRTVNIIAGSVAVLLVTIAAHLGGEITHGKGFVTAPLKTPTDSVKEVQPESALLFADLVQPILESKCINCHNPSKSKGELDMSDMAMLLKGGKTGPLWDSLSPAKSLLLQRIHLPDSEEEHMPPAGKPQLTDTEKYILWSWIRHGASFSATTATLPPNDSLKAIAAAQFSSRPAEQYHFAAASEATIQQLNNNYRVVQAIAHQSPALKVNFFGAAQYKPAQLEELLAIKDQLVSLSLNKMPAGDEAISVLQQCKELRQLNLGFTNITGKNLSQLQSLTHLQQLTLSGTAVNVEALSQLGNLPALKKIYIWNSHIKAPELASLQQRMKSVRLEAGYQNDTSMLKLPKPALLNETDIIQGPVPLLLKNFIANAEIRYTLDGTEPDSLHSPVYNKQTMIQQQGPLKAKVFKAGWQSSDLLEAYFFKTKYRPDSIWNIKPTEKYYQYIPAKKLADMVRGDKDNFRDGEWLAYHEGNMESMLSFSQPIDVSSVSMSYLFDPGSYIMPPVYAELWGGTEPGQLQLLKKVNGNQPDHMDSKRVEALSFEIPSRSIRYLKIVVKPVDKLPNWHPGKGQPGWFFVDEIYVN